MSEPGQDRLQPGIYFRPKERPRACWRLVLLDFESGVGANEARVAVAALAAMLRGLRAGSVRELLSQPSRDLEATRATFEKLDWLWGYGRRFFDRDRHDPPLTTADRPEFLAYLPASGDPFPALPWDDGADRTGEADLALQLTGESEAAVNRAAVEVWKLLEDERLPLRIAGWFDGFLRPDGRGWLEFHDGVSNIESSQRLKVLTAGGDPEWVAGGTYMAFLRCRVALAAWRSLPRPEQELIVGRDKPTGSPLVATERDASGRAVPVPAAALPADPSDEQLADYHDPPQATDPLLEASHVHRANQNRSSPHAPAAWRIFRQGYDFLDSLGPDGPLLGLNFVSFQGNLAALQHILHLPGWLADVNFGGPAESGRGDPLSPQLITLLAGGLYAVPPVAEPFAGACLFSSGASRPAEA